MDEHAWIWLVVGAVVAFVVFVIRRRSVQTIRHETPQVSRNGVTCSVPRMHLEPSEIERYIRLHMVQIAEEQFPDNPGLQWTIHNFEHKGHLTYVEVEPSPLEVGYPRFKFVVTCANKESPEVIATYCLDGDAYTLLSTARGCIENLPKTLV